MSLLLDDLKIITSPEAAQSRISIHIEESLNKEGGSRAEAVKQLQADYEELAQAGKNGDLDWNMAKIFRHKCTELGVVLTKAKTVPTVMSLFSESKVLPIPPSKEPLCLSQLFAMAKGNLLLELKAINADDVRANKSECAQSGISEYIEDLLNKEGTSREGVIQQLQADYQELVQAENSGDLRNISGVAKFFYGKCSELGAVLAKASLADNKDSADRMTRETKDAVEQLFLKHKNSPTICLLEGLQEYYQQLKTKKADDALRCFYDACDSCFRKNGTQVDIPDIFEDNAPSRNRPGCR